MRGIVLVVGGEIAAHPAATRASRYFATTEKERMKDEG
jgi:hypothetical protein